MRQALAQIKNNDFPQLNEWDISENDCWRFVKRRRLYVRTDAQLIVNGYYGRRLYRKRWRDYILLDAKLRGLAFLEAFLHEICHVCLHAPSGNNGVLFSRRDKDPEMKYDKEAEAFALQGMLPLPRFLQLIDTPLEELHPFTLDVLLRRKKLFEKIKD